MRKATSSVSIQLRTGWVALPGNLNKINRRDSPSCSCDQGNQTVQHVLLECPRLADLRSDMRTRLDERGISMALGADGLLSAAAAGPIMANFMFKSGLLGQFLEVDLGVIGMSINQ